MNNLLKPTRYDTKTNENQISSKSNRQDGRLTRDNSLGQNSIGNYNTNPAEQRMISTNHGIKGGWRDRKNTIYQ